MLSKIIGIKVIAELKSKKRIVLIISLIVIAEIALVAFGFVPFPYNFVFLFLNGLPLGMVWGVIFSYLEGRKLTEFLALGLSLNLVMTSGVLKTIYGCGNNHSYYFSRIFCLLEGLQPTLHS
jgi:hypothetical protein